jgi:hypothetical protein
MAPSLQTRLFGVYGSGLVDGKDDRHVDVVCQGPRSGEGNRGGKETRAAKEAAGAA